MPTSIGEEVTSEAADRSARGVWAAALSWEACDLDDSGAFLCGESAGGVVVAAAAAAVIRDNRPTPIILAPAPGTTTATATRPLPPADEFSLSFRPPCPRGVWWWWWW